MAVETRTLLGLDSDGLASDFVDLSFTENCEDVSNVVSMLDRFFIVHLLGYFVMAFSIRDAKLTWIVSVNFEVIEMALKNWMDNFKECWYDSLLLDVLLCNNLGIIMGLVVSTYLREKRGWWWLKRMEGGFWMQVCVVTSTLISILNAFFLKAVLFVPAEHAINPIRMALMGLELYFFVIEGVGFMFALGCVTLGLELSVVFRHGIEGGLFVIEHLPIWGRLYIGFVFFALVWSTAMLALTIEQKKPSSTPSKERKAL